MKVERAAGPNVEAPTTGAPAFIETHGLSFTYHQSARPALSGISFAQRQGEMVGVMGASGAGKSTFAKCLNRIIPELEDGVFEGTIHLDGRSLEGVSVAELAGTVAMVFQDFEAQLFCTTVAQEVAFALEQMAMEREQMKKRVAQAIEAVGLRGFERRDPTSLSGGEKQRLAIAAVLALNPSLVLLDEPTTDLDPEGKVQVFELIARLRTSGHNLIVIEHEAEELRRCDRLLLIDDGKVAADAAPAQLLAEVELLERCGVHAPGLNRVLNGLGIRAHAQNVDHAEDMIRNRFAHRLPVAAPTPLSTELESCDPLPIDTRRVDGSPSGPLAEVRSASFAYPEGPPVVSSVDLEIREGEFVALVGQNGSGKTTLAKLIVGLLRPTAGVVAIAGKDIGRADAAGVARQVGYVFQNPDHQIFADSVEDEVAFGPRNLGLAPGEVKRRSETVLEAVGLTAQRASDPFLLSKGERQRLAVASVLAMQPRLLILDEPTTGLDYREQRRMMHLVVELNRSGIAILMITHTPWLVTEYAHRVVLMRAGRKLFDGGVRAFVSGDAMLARSSFRVPEVTQLARRFGAISLSAEEFVRWLKTQV